MLSSSRDKLIKLWDVANGYCVQNFYKHSDWVRMVLVNQSGTLFASCSNDKVIYTDNDLLFLVLYFRR